MLPPGQRESSVFHRFGLTPFASRFPAETERQVLRLSGAVAQAIEVENPLAELTRVDQVADFHCVTTWSVRGLLWQGVRFSEFYDRVIRPLARPDEDAKLLAITAQDGARTGMYLEDLLDPSVILADRLNGEPLTVDHGAPLRLVAPKHYGYKSVKYIKEFRFLQAHEDYPATGLKFMDHPRARVEHEERGRVLPGSLLRYLYRPLVRGTARRFADASRQRSAGQHGHTRD